MFKSEMLNKENGFQMIFRNSHFSEPYLLKLNVNSDKESKMFGANSGE